MSVVEELRAFRYTTADIRGAAVAGRELPWKVVRSVNVAAMKTEEPDLHLMKNLLSLLSDFTITSSTPVQGASDADLLQLLQLMQVSLQFALHSQQVLKRQLVERQNLEAVRQVSAKYMERMEAKVSVLTADSKTLKEECDTLRMSADALRRSLAEQEATARTLERQLERERARFYATVTRQEKLLQLTKPADIPQGSGSSPTANVAVVAVKGNACPTCGRTVPMGSRDIDGRDERDIPEESTRPRMVTSRRHKSNRHHHHRRDRHGCVNHDSGDETSTTTSVTLADTSSLTTESVPNSRGTATEEERIALGLPALCRRRKDGQRRSPREKKRRYVDWDTLAAVAEVMQRKQPRQPSPLGRSARQCHSQDDNCQDLLSESECSVPVDARDHSSSELGNFVPSSSAAPARHGVPQRMRSTGGSVTATRPVADDVRAQLASALDGLKMDVKEQLATACQTIAATSQRLEGELAHLRKSQAHLEARLATNLVAQPQRRPPSRTTSSKPWQPSSSAPAAFLPPPDLPRRQQAQESVTPLAPSLSLTPIEHSFSPVMPANALSPPLERDAKLQVPSGSDKPVGEPAAAVAASTQQPGSPLSFTAQTGQTMTEGSGRGGPVPEAARSSREGSVAASTTNATLTTGVSLTDRKGLRATPSLHTGSLSSKSRRLPDFDVSQLRTPPKHRTEGEEAGGMQSAHQHSNAAADRSSSSSAVVGSPAPEAVNTTERSTTSAGVEKSAAGGSSARGPVDSSVGSNAGAQSPGNKRWYDTPSEEQPASVAARAQAVAGDEGASRDSTTFGSLFFLPRNSTPSAVNGGEGNATCEHCHQLLPLPQLKEHEDNCGLRLVTCASCGRRIVAQQMPRHQCSFPDADAREAASGHGSLHTGTASAPLADAGAAPPAASGAHSLESSRASSRAGSLGPKRASSLMLQETQRELQQLLEEEEAFQRSRNNMSNMSSVSDA